MTERRKTALHVHVNSAWTYFHHLGHRTDEAKTDAAYSAMMPRIVEWAEQRGARLTIFVIGKDLLVAEHADLVRKWHANGHEIANHSWAHPPQLIALSDNEIRMEISRAHEIIAETVGEPPVGYTAPGWYDDARTWPVLEQLGYRYDCSLFPSWFMLALPLIVWW